MLDSIPDPSVLKPFLCPPSGERWRVKKLWGTPLLIRAGDELHFSFDSAQGAKLDVYTPSTDLDDKYISSTEQIRFSSRLQYAGGMLFASADNIDLVFRVDERGDLYFDQDLDDNGAPRNGGGTGMGAGT